MTFAGQLIRHIGSCITAEKGKRILYAVVNIAFMALAVLSGWGVVKAWEMMFSATFIGGLLLLIVCAAFAVLFLIDGVIGQVIHAVVNFIFIFNREERGYAICACILALLSVAAAVVAVILLIK